MEKHKDGSRMKMYFVKYHEDFLRIKRTLKYLMETQHEDGGWKCNKFPYERGP